MGNIRKTISYLKRNGVVKTYHRIVEQKKNNNLFANYNSDRKNEIADAEELKKQANTVFDKMPLVSIVVPLYKTNENYLRAMIDSVLLQSYENWELILPDGSMDDCCSTVLFEYDDERIIYFKLDRNDGISGNTNAGISKAKGEIISFMDHDDYIEPDALYYIVKAFNEGALAVYTDEDKVRSNGDDYFMPNKKYDFNYDLFLANNYICHMFAASRDIVTAVGNLNSEFDGAQDFDFILRCVEQIAQINGSYAGLEKYILHIPKVLYHWRTHELSTADNPDSKLYAYDAGLRAVRAHMRRRNIEVTVRHTDHLGYYHIDYKDIFTRPEVGAYVGRLARMKEYNDSEGPFFKNGDGKLYNPYSGLKIYESGYMHRAKMQQDVADAWRDYATIRPECKNIKMEDIIQNGYLVVFDPEKLV